MIYFTLRDQDRSFCGQVIGNIMLSKCFDEMRLLRSLRPLRSIEDIVNEIDFQKRFDPIIAPQDKTLTFILSRA